MKIPFFSKKNNAEMTKRALAPRHADFKPTSHFTESFNTLRANIRFARLDAPVKVLLITGAAPLEGKTTVTVNLAESFAFAGQKVLLMECDLRLATFKDMFKCDPGQGLSTLISETFDTPVKKGVIGELSLGDIMTLIGLQEKTGTLTITDNNDDFLFSFERGKLVSSVWGNRPKSKRVAAMLVKSGKITEQQASEALQRAQGSGQRLGFILISMGIVTPDDLTGPLRLQIMDSLSRAFNLSGAEFSFEKSSHVFYDRGIIDPIRFRNVLTDELPGLRVRPFLYKEIASSIIETDVKNLYVLPGGPMPPNPSELIGSRRMTELMDMLRDALDYDILLIDSPPVTSVSDAAVLSSFADAVVMVVRAGAMNRAVIKKAVDQLKQVNAPIMGFVLNAMDPKEEKHYYSYYYKYYNDYFDKAGSKE